MDLHLGDLFFLPFHCREQALDRTDVSDVIHMSAKIDIGRPDGIGGKFLSLKIFIKLCERFRDGKIVYRFKPFRI